MLNIVAKNYRLYNVSMKNYYKFALLVGLVGILIPAYIYAAEFRSGEQVSFPSGERTSDDVYIGGGNVTSAGAVNGDLLVGGGTVLVTGSVGGDLMAGGGNITIMGDVADDLRAAGGTIIVNGNVRGDVILGGGQVHLTGQTIGGDAVVGGGAVTIDSAIAGDLKAGGGNVYLNSTVGGNVDIMATKLTLGPKANIAGNLFYQSPNAAEIDAGAVVKGETTRKELVMDKKNTTGFVVFGLLAKFLMILAGALIFGLTFKRFSHKLVATATDKPGLEFGRGLVFMIITPIISLLLFATVIGIPLGILAILGFFASLIFAYLSMSVVLGSVLYKWILKKGVYEVSWKTIVLGAVSVIILGCIPFIGWLAILISFVITLGSAVNIKWSLVKEWR
jgi:hypothetical protein